MRPLSRPPAPSEKLARSKKRGAGACKHTSVFLDLTQNPQGPDLYLGEDDDSNFPVTIILMVGLQMDLSSMASICAQVSISVRGTDAARGPNDRLAGRPPAGGNRRGGRGNGLTSLYSVF